MAVFLTGWLLIGLLATVRFVQNGDGWPRGKEWLFIPMVVMAWPLWIHRLFDYPNGKR
jgi:hypothetical protein